MELQSKTKPGLVMALGTHQICSKVYSFSAHRDRRNLRLTCRGLRAQVDLCIQSVGWDLVFVSAAQVEDWARTLRTTGLRPRKVWLRGGDKFHHLPMSPDVQHVWQKVESLKVAAPLLSASYVEALAASMPELQELQLDGRLAEDGDWLAAVKRLSNLTTLKLIWLWDYKPGEDVPSSVFIALEHAARLRSLAAMYSCNYPALSALTQLQDLTLSVPTTDSVPTTPQPTQDLSALSRLTSLTSLTFQSTCSKAPAPQWQSQLASALTALTGLQRLQLPQVWEGPVAEALRQMPGLAQLELSQRQRGATTLRLPYVKLLRLKVVDPSFLAAVDAPQLQALLPETWEPGAADLGAHPQLIMLLKEGGSPGQLAATMEQCARGVLRQCNNLILQGRGTAPEAVLAAVQALGRTWRPDPSLVDGTSTFVRQPTLAGHSPDGNAHTHASVDPTTSSVVPTEAGGPALVAGAVAGWTLALANTVCCRAMFAALLQGLTRLELGCCGLEPDALEPLTQLSSLRELSFSGEPESQPLTPGAFAQLFRTATQGYHLKVYLSNSCVAPEVVEECRAARAALVAERGSLNVPRLEIS